ncbi:unnamed protein product [Closterium sp. NIES-64]|nr:unnamed protein product [Closterium sp. NIES-64]
MHCRLLVSGLPRSLPPLLTLPTPPCLPCVEGRQRTAPHCSSFPPTEAPLQTLHLDVWGPARVRGQGVRYAAQQLNLWPRVSLPETSPTLRWTGEVGDASRFRVWGARALVRDTSADKLSSRTIPCVFLGFVPGAPGWQFYHPTLRRVFPSQDVTFDESVPFYRLFPHRTAPLPPPSLFLTPGPPPVDHLPPQGPAPSGVSQVDPPPLVEPVEVNSDSGAAAGGAAGGATSGGAEPARGVLGSAEPGGAEPAGAEPGGAESAGVPLGLVLEVLVLEVLELEVPVLGVLLLEVMGLAALELVLPTLALETLELEVLVLGVLLLEALALVPSTLELGTLRLELPVLEVLLLKALELEVLELLEALELEVLLLEALELEVLQLEALELEVLELLEALELEVVLLEALELEVLELLEALELEVLLVEALELEVLELLEALELEVPQVLEVLELLVLVALHSRDCSSLRRRLQPGSDLVHAAHPTVTRLLATVVTDLSFESATASALVSKLVDFAAAYRLDFAASLVAESESVNPPSVGGECALGTDVLEDKQEEFECLAAAAPHLVAMLLAPEGDSDAPDIPTPCSYAEAIAGEYSSQWQTAMDAEMAFWKSTGTYVDAVPPPGANVVNGMWIFRVKRPPGSPPVSKARYVARGFNQQQGVDFFHTFSPTPKMTTLRVLLRVAAQRDYELHSLDFSTAFL